MSELIADQNTFVSLVLPHLDQVIEMIEKNIFRPLPILRKQNNPSEVNDIEDEPLVDVAWPHLQPIYEFFLQLIVNEAADVKSLKVFITHPFI